MSKIKLNLTSVYLMRRPEELSKLNSGVAQINQQQFRALAKQEPRRGDISIAPYKRRVVDGAQCGVRTIRHTKGPRRTVTQKQNN